MTALQRVLPVRARLVLAVVALLILLDRAGAFFAAHLAPGAEPVALPGNWLAVQRMDHIADGGLAMVVFGFLTLGAALALTYFPDELPAQRLMLVSASCTTAGILANGISVLVAGGAMDFLVVHDPVWLIRLAAAYNGVPIPVAPIIHFVPADVCLWAGFTLWAVWAAVAALTTLTDRLTALVVRT